MGSTGINCLLEHLVMDFHKLVLEVVSQSVDSKLFTLRFFTKMSNLAFELVFVEVSLAHLKSDRSTSLFPEHALVLEGLAFVQINSNADSAFSESLANLITLSKYKVLVIPLIYDSQNDYLSLGRLWR